MDVLVFARHWAPGAVKTRLCPPLTTPQATAVYLACLDTLLSRLGAHPALAVTIAYEPEPARPAFAARYPQVELTPQRGDELGEKLRRLVGSRVTPCLITGSDCPTVPLAYYAQAIAAFCQGADVVLGPTEDGGSYLLGARPACADWFTDIPWSTAHVAAALRARAAEQGWQLVELPPWYDVDTIQDVLRFVADLPPAGDLST